MHVLGIKKCYLFLPEKSKPGCTAAVPHASRGVPVGAAGVGLAKKSPGRLLLFANIPLPGMLP